MKRIALAAGLTFAAIAAPALAQSPPPFERIPLQTTE